MIWRRITCLIEALLLQQLAAWMPIRWLLSTNNLTPSIIKTLITFLYTLSQGNILTVMKIHLKSPHTIKEASLWSLKTLVLIRRYDTFKYQILLKIVLLLFCLFHGLYVFISLLIGSKNSPWWRQNRTAPFRKRSDGHSERRNGPSWRK